MLDATRSQPPKLLDEVRRVLRLHHYSMHTERSSVEGIVRFVRFHGMRSRHDLFPAEPKIEAFLTDLAVHGHVAAATQNQAMNALVVLSKRVPNHAEVKGMPHLRGLHSLARAAQLSELCLRVTCAWRRHPGSASALLREAYRATAGRSCHGSGKVQAVQGSTPMAWSTSP